MENYSVSMLEYLELKEAYELLQESQRRLQRTVERQTLELEAAHAKLAQQIDEHKDVEQQLLLHQERLRMLSKKLWLTEERERRAIAADLHDRIGQSLALIKMMINSLKNDPRLSGMVLDVEPIDTLLSQTIEETRTLVFEISPPILYKLGLGAAAKWLAEKIEVQSGITIQITGENEVVPLDDIVAATLFRAIREALINVVKHSEAPMAAVWFSTQDEVLKITITDNGSGFDQTLLDAGSSAGGGFGLFSIQERLKFLKGKMAVESKPGQGTRIALEVPIKTDTIL
jgi:signal transduction histidine kinase